MLQLTSIQCWVPAAWPEYKSACIERDTSFLQAHQVSASLACILSVRLMLVSNTFTVSSSASARRMLLLVARPHTAAAAVVATPT